jgi:hypothetical protein
MVPSITAIRISHLGSSPFFVADAPMSVIRTPSYIWLIRAGGYSLLSIATFSAENSPDRDPDLTSQSKSWFGRGNLAETA